MDNIDEAVYFKKCLNIHHASTAFLPFDDHSGSSLRSARRGYGVLVGSGVSVGILVLVAVGVRVTVPVLVGETVREGVRVREGVIVGIAVGASPSRRNCPITFHS